MIETRDKWYDPVKDVEAVRQDDYLDLKEAFVNGVVPGALDFEELPSNGLESLSSIGNKVTDPFQADRARKSISKPASQAQAPEEPAD